MRNIQQLQDQIARDPVTEVHVGAMARTGIPSHHPSGVSTPQNGAPRREAGNVATHGAASAFHGENMAHVVRHTYSYF